VGKLHQPAVDQLRLLDQREVEDDPDGRLAGLLQRLLGNRANRERMRRAMRPLAQPDAAWDVATIIRGLLPTSRRPAALNL